jgi:hypothetical protein
MQSMLSNGSYTRHFAGDREGSVYPRFFIEPVIDRMASEAAGRPIYRDEERVEILMPAIANTTIPVERVNDQHIQRWPEDYKAFKEGLEPALNGFPLEEWPVLRRGQVLELKALHFRTVEDIAAMSDLAIQKVGMGGIQLRNAAKAFLDDAEHVALTEQQSKRIDLLTAENTALKNQVEELGTLTRQIHAEMMQMKNAQHPIATAIPGMADPLQLGAYEQPAAQREMPQSSFASFANEGRRRGRPPKARTDEAA